MSRSAGNSGGSLLLAEEYFGAEDDRFVEALRDVSGPKQLAGFVDRWKRDPRPWARQQILAYLDQPLDSLGHNVVVKRLFKHAEAGQDDLLMAAFLYVFDRLVRRERKKRWQYDWQTGETWSEEFLASPRNVMPLGRTRTYRDPWTGRTASVPSYVPPNARLFSYRTRHYLRRRAWRYFRRMAFQRPESYVPWICRALASYEDDDLAKGENILDSWALMHACFREHDALEFGAARVRLKSGRSVGELSPAPRFPQLWQRAESMRELMGLVTSAKARLIRVWAMQLLKREHRDRLADLSVDGLLGVLDHPDEEVQAFGAELFKELPDLEKLPIAKWLRLLETKSTSALVVICETMQKHVTVDRLELADCIKLACAESAPVARMGLDFLKQRRYETPEDRDALAAVSLARCFATAGELARWALEILGSKEAYDRELMLRFFDSLQRPIREAAWDWLVGEDSAGYDDAVLWCRLLETPYDDLRLRMVDLLERRSALPGAGTGDLRPVWCSVLLGVHRGGRQKAKATRQIARALEDDPSQADTLLPVLVAAIRSVRPAEARAGLAAVVRAVEARPELADQVRRLLPELKLSADEAVA